MKNTILYFVPSAKVRPADKAAATAINAATNIPVVFRNASIDNASAEFPEQNKGVAGKVPAKYAGAVRYDDSGTIVESGTPAPVLEVVEVEKNELGLPVSCGIETREALKKALDEAGIDFHGNAKTEALVDLYTAQVLEA